VEQENHKQENENLFSKRLRAGRRRTYFFDVRSTRSNDYYLTITESKKRFNEDGYDRHKIFLYKEDFNKFIDGLQETIDHIKSELLPEYDFDEFTRKDDDYSSGENYSKENSASEDKTASTEEEAPVETAAEAVTEEVATEETATEETTTEAAAEDTSAEEQPAEVKVEAGTDEKPSEGEEEALKWD